MNAKDLIAKAEVNINAPAHEVWKALTDPDKIKKYMFGTTVESDWKENGKISWKGEWQGKPYEDKGIILQMKPEKMMQYSHYSHLSGLPDVPENYDTLITIELTPKEKQTFVTLTQDNNATEETRKHSEENWGMMLDSMKKLVEG